MSSTQELGFVPPDRVEAPASCDRAEAPLQDNPIGVVVETGPSGSRDRPKRQRASPASRAAARVDPAPVGPAPVGPAPVEASQHSQQQSGDDYDVPDEELRKISQWLKES